MIIDCVSDLHGYYPKLEGRDLLIIAGDMTSQNDEAGWNYFDQWLYEQKYKDKIIVAGNHDNFLQSMDAHRMYKYWEKNPNVTYLCDSGIRFPYFDDRFPEEDEGFLPSGHRVLKIWGSPWTKTFEGMNPKCKAFTCETEEELAEKWSLIPDDTDILITHSPPLGIMDAVFDWRTRRFKSAGSPSLLKRVKEIKPRFHVFGHIHEGGGCHSEDDIDFINASHVNENYEPVNQLIRIEL